MGLNTTLSYSRMDLHVQFQANFENITFLHFQMDNFLIFVSYIHGRISLGRLKVLQVGSCLPSSDVLIFSQHEGVCMCVPFYASFLIRIVFTNIRM